MSLPDVLVALCGAFSAAACHDELVNGIALRCRDEHIDARSVEHDRWLGFMDEKVEKTERLSIGTKGGQGLRRVRVRPPVWCQEVDAQTASGFVARDSPCVVRVRNWTKGLVDFLQDFEDRRCAVLDGYRHVGKLRNVDIAGLNGCGRQPYSKHGWISLVRDRSNEHAAKSKHARLRQCRNNIANQRRGPGQVGGARQGGDQGLSVPMVMACVFVVADALQELRRFWPDISLVAHSLRWNLKVPVTAPSDGFRSEDAVFRKGVVERRRSSAIEKIGVDGLQCERNVGGHIKIIRV